MIIDSFSVDYIIAETNHYIPVWLEPHKITIGYVQGNKFYDYVEPNDVFGELTPSYIKKLVSANIPKEITDYPPTHIHGAICNSPY